MSTMKKLRKLAAILVVLCLLAVAILAVLPRGGDAMPPVASDLDTARHKTIAVFGATGTVGDGLLKAVMHDPDVETIHVITRRSAPRIEEGVTSGRVTMTTHMDYLDYSELGEILVEVDTVYWAIGTSARNVDKERYGVIHVDFPVAFLEQWMGLGNDGELSFHYVSGSGAGEDSSWHWAREKARAERALFDLAEGTNIRVISYRPAAIVHSTEMAGLGDKLIEFVFEPFKLAIRSTVVGRAMIEVSARGGEIVHGTILENRDIRMYGAVGGAPHNSNHDGGR